MNKHLLLTTILLPAVMMAEAQVSVVIDAESDNFPLSPYIYGKNGATSDQATPTNAADMLRMREAGLRFARMNNGNNATKYNWRRKLTCHPDWYKNVYPCNWDQSASDLQTELPGVQGMYAFQLIGKAAKTSAYNFNDWAYNQSQWGEWCSKPVCGGGELDAAGNLVKKGDASLYLEDWPADSTVGIYKHWRDELGLDMSQFQYWSMDNEFEMWPWTHSDVVEKNSDEVFEMMMQNYFATAKAIRAIDPSVKLCGPVAGSEWTWYTPADCQPTYKGKKYCWLEYFIMRCAEEEKATGVNMLDVLDIHFYPGDKTVANVLQAHRVLWDRDFVYPEANGVKTVNGGWDENQRKEYIFGRCQDWIDNYFGPNRGITFGISEYNNIESFSSSVTAVGYASFIGEGARHGMEYFTPWTWKNGMWETLHLFGRYAKDLNVSAVSSNENMLSAYTSISSDRDSMTIILVNRSENGAEKVNLTIGNFDAQDGKVETYQLANLPNSESFNSHTDNALQKGEAVVVSNTMSVEVPHLSVTAIVVPSVHTGVDGFAAQPVAVYPNPTTDVLYVSNDGTIKSVDIVNISGVVVKTVNASADDDVTISVADLDKAVYLVRIRTAGGVKFSTVVVK
ncbi:MAG: T9SS type A sorting domain-containing protein [Paludibacteraceae bacterium]|nr:T9SS type A sorting domain-containing protein [Paludibacteraceae bacterium]